MIYILYIYNFNKNVERKNFAWHKKILLDSRILIFLSILYITLIFLSIYMYLTWDRSIDSKSLFASIY